MVTISPNVLIVRKDSPYRTFADFLAAAKRNPGKVTCATTGMGTANQLSMEVVKIQAGISIALLPFKSGGEVNVALLGGHVDLASQGFSPALALLTSGDIRALASLSGKIKSFPGVPTLGELGYAKAELRASSVGYLLPKGTPQPIVNKLAAAFKKAMKNPQVEKNLENVGQFLDYEDGATFAKSLAADRKIIEDVAVQVKLVK